nr:nucleotide-binding alpha-beta plait domain-containing protein [Tanacetum cinerariifolium]
MVQFLMMAVVRRLWLIADEDDNGGEVEGDGGMEMTADVVAADEDGGWEMVTAAMAAVVGGDSDGGHGDGGVAVIDSWPESGDGAGNLEMRGEKILMASQRSKEDDVQKISTSVFVTNFPDGYGAKDLWNTCKLYGHVVDVFIHDRRTKTGVLLELTVPLSAEFEIPPFISKSTSLSIEIIQAHNDFVIDEKVIWVKAKGVLCMTCWVRAIEVPGWVPDFEEDGEEGYDVNDGSHEDDMYGGVSENIKDVEGKSNREEVLETNFKDVPDKSIFEGNSVRQNDVHYKDPFGIYEVLKKKRDGKNIDDKHEDSLKYPPGKMEYAWDNMFMSGWRFQMTHMSPHVLDILRSRKYLVKRPKWRKLIFGALRGVVGNFTFDYVYSESIGVWVSSGKRLLIISVYAPQDLSQKKMLWDYLSFVIGNWDGEVVWEILMKCVTLVR